VCEDSRMKSKHLYLALCVAGLVLPYGAFAPWVVQHRLNLRLLLDDLFANRVSAFFGLDVLVSAVVLFRFISVERRRVSIRFWWTPIAAALCVGVSLGLPLFLYLRESALEQANGSAVLLR
jgi:hypothetical protein